MIEQASTELIAKLLAEIGVFAAKGIFGTSELAPEKRGIPDHDIGDAWTKLASADDLGESPRFLARQRLLHRIDLARVKWEWLVAATHYHPIAGKITSIPPNWHPRTIGGQYTVADFTTHELPHQAEIGESAPSHARVRIIQGRIAIANELIDTIEELGKALRGRTAAFGFPDPPWSYPSLEIPWISLMTEISGRTFGGLPQFKSFCGFKDLWSVRDTPASGIQERGQDTPGLAAYGHVAELVWLLIAQEPQFRDAYSAERKKGHALSHQFALRKIAVRTLKTIWTHSKSHSVIE